MVAFNHPQEDQGGDHMVEVQSSLDPLAAVELCELASRETSEWIKMLNAIETIGREATPGDEAEYETRRIFATFLTHRIEYVLDRDGQEVRLQPWMRSILTWIRDEMKAVAKLPPAGL